MKSIPPHLDAAAVPRFWAGGWYSVHVDEAARTFRARAAGHVGSPGILATMEDRAEAEILAMLEAPPIALAIFP